MKLVFLLTLLLHFISAEVDIIDDQPAFQMVTMTEWATKIETSIFYKVISESVTTTINVIGTRLNVQTETRTTTLTNLITITELRYTMQTLFLTDFSFVTETVSS